MTDFTIEWFQACATTTLADTFASGRNADVHYEAIVSLDGQLDRCTCPGYNFHRRCKHISMLRERLCGWDERTGIAQTPQQEMEGKCPKCGADTVQVRQAV